MPFCFTIVKVGDHKRIVKNPDTADIMEDLLEHIHRYQSKRKTLLYINAKYNMTLSYPSLDKLLKNPMLYGEYRGNPNYLAEQDRYMSKEDFLSMQKCLKRQVKNNTVNRDYLFTGLIKCPVCGNILKGTSYSYKTAKGEKRVLKKYKCSKHKLYGACTFNKVISEKVFEKMMLENIEKYFDKAKAVIENPVPSEKIVPKVSVEDVQAEIDRLNYSWQKGRIKKVEEYDRQYDELMAKLEEAQAVHEEEVERDFSKVESALQDGWKGIYDALDDAHKRSFWRSFIESIEVHWTTEKKTIERVNFF